VFELLLGYATRQKLAQRSEVRANALLLADIHRKFTLGDYTSISDLHLKFALRPHHVWKYGIMADIQSAAAEIRR